MIDSYAWMENKNWAEKFLKEAVQSFGQNERHQGHNTYTRETSVELNEWLLDASSGIINSEFLNQRAIALLEKIQYLSPSTKRYTVQSSFPKDRLLTIVFNHAVLVPRKEFKDSIPKIFERTATEELVDNFESILLTSAKTLPSIILWCATIAAGALTVYGIFFHFTEIQALINQFIQHVYNESIVGSLGIANSKFLLNFLDFLYSSLKFVYEKRMEILLGSIALDSIFHIDFLNVREIVLSFDLNDWLAILLGFNDSLRGVQWTFLVHAYDLILSIHSHAKQLIESFSCSIDAIEESKKQNLLIKAWDRLYQKETAEV
jgi:hypothetical protein